MSSYEVTVEEDEYIVDLGNNGVGGIAQASLAKAGRVAIPLGQRQVSVSFVTAIDSVANFALVATVQNLLDSDPQDLSVLVKAYTVNGATFQVNAPTDTANYSVAWVLVPTSNG